MADNKTAKGKTTVANGDNGHDDKGRFAEGNTAGGNPYAGYITKLRTALYNAVCEQDIIDIATAQIRKAKTSTEAAKFVYNYVIGKPKETVEISGADGNAIKVDIGGDLSEEEIKRIAEAVSAGRGAIK